MKKIKVSIIIPVYNVEKYLSRCLDSIINQTYRNLEIICVNDGSTDNSLEIIKNYSKNDSRIRIINQENSGGVIARKNGVLLASGMYCLLLDSDDWIELNTIEILVDYLKKYNNPDIIKYRFIREPEKQEQKKLFDNVLFIDSDNKSIVLEKLLYSNDFNAIWNSMVKKSLFDFNSFVYDYIVRKGEDLQINFQIYLKANNYLIVNDVLYHYFSNPQSLSNNCTIDKAKRNIVDMIYRHKLKNKIAESEKYKINNQIIEKRLLDDLVLILKVLLRNGLIKKKDLVTIQNFLLEKDFYENVESFSLKEFNSSILDRFFIKCIINKKVDRLIIYKYLRKFKKIIIGV